MKVSGCLALLAVGTSAQPVVAQKQEQAYPAAAEDIVVTAQKREQRITDVPMAISAYDSAFLERVGAVELARVAQIAPGLSLQLQDRLLPGISMRGITSDDTSPGAEPRVALFQDGVPITQIASAYAELFDVDRVEVEKGPQSTLHGRSALNGGISIFQKMPTGQLGAEFKGGIGNYGYRQAQAVVNLPVSDRFGLRVGGLLHRQDGYLKDLAGGASYNSINSRAVRLTARYAPTDALTVKLAATYDKDDTGSGGAFKSGVFVPLDQATGAVAGDARFWTPTHINTLTGMRAAYSRREILGLSGTTEYDLGPKFKLAAVTGYRWYKACQAGDIDGTPTDIIAYDQCNRGRQFSQELRLNLTGVGPFEGFVGGSYFRANNRLDLDLGADERAAALLLNGTLRGLAPKGLTNAQINALLGARAAALKPLHIDRRAQTARIETYDLFADGTWHLTDQLEAFAGGRVTWDNKDVTLQVTTPLGVSRLTGRGLLIGSTPGTAPLAGSLGSTLLTGRAGLRYVASPQVNLYAVYAIGKRPEVLELTSAGSQTVTPEERLTSAEAGIKLRLLDGRLIGDASVYHYRYANFQTFQRLNGALVSVNAGQADATGFEAQANWRATRGLALFGSFGYNHARFRSGAYSGNRFRNSPDTKFAVGFTADAELPVGTLSLAPTYSWQSGIFFSDDNDRADLQVRSPAAFSDTAVDERQAAYGLLSARLSFTARNAPWSLALIGDNLLDQKYIVDAGNTGDVFGIPTFVTGTRRTVRVEFSLKL